MTWKPRACAPVRPVPLVLGGTGAWPGARPVAPYRGSDRFRDDNTRLAALDVAPPDARRVRRPKTFSTAERLRSHMFGARHDDDEEDKGFMRRLAAKRRNPFAILSPREVVYLAELEIAAEPPGDCDVQSIEDHVRWDAVWHACEQTRTARGLSMSGAARQLGVPARALGALRCPCGLRDTALATEYIRLLGLERWFARWIRWNRRLAERLGLPSD